MDLPGSPSRRRLTQMHQVHENLLRANCEQLVRAERAFHRSFSREFTDLRKRWLGPEGPPGGAQAPGSSQPGSPVPTQSSYNLDRIAGAVSPPILRRTKSVFQFPEVSGAVSEPASSPSDSETSLDTVTRARQRMAVGDNSPPAGELADGELAVGSVESRASADWTTVLESELVAGEEMWQRAIRRRRQERCKGRREEREHVAALLGGCQMTRPRGQMPVTRVKSLPSYMQSTAATRSKKFAERKLGSDSP